MNEEYLKLYNVLYQNNEQHFQSNKIYKHTILYFPGIHTD